MNCTIRFAFLVSLSVGCANAHASWIRGNGGIGAGESIDPLIQSIPPFPLIPTVSTGQFSDAQKGFFSQADLGNGALRGRAFVSSGSGSARANPTMGETISFNNDSDEASFWDFSFAVDGTVVTGSPGFPVEQDFGPSGVFRTSFVQIALHVFEGNSVGPNGEPDSWVDQLGSALFSEVKNVDGFPLTGTADGLNEFLNDSISGSLPLAPGVNSFDVVAIMAVAGSIPSNFDSSFDFSFLSTAALSIDSPIEFTSDSGVFLTGENVIPEPGAIALTACGLYGLALFRRR